MSREVFWAVAGVCVGGAEDDTQGSTPLQRADADGMQGGCPKVKP